MSHFFASVVFLALVTVGCAATVPVRQADRVSAPVTIGTSYTLASDVLGEDRQINVWTPDGYDEDRPVYGVIYLLDGALDQDFEHIAGLAQLGALSWTYETFIVVGIQTKDRQHELTPQPTDGRFIKGFPTAGGAGDFRRFIEEEVKPFIEGKYRTGKRKVLMGESLAGLFVVDTLLETPDAFDDYIAISPSLWWDGMNYSAGARAKLDTFGNDDRRLWLALADEGGMMETGMDILRAALSDVPTEVVDHHFTDYSETESHSTIYHRAALDAFRSLFALPPFDGNTLWYMDEFGEPPLEETSAD